MTGRTARAPCGAAPRAGCPVAAAPQSPASERAPTVQLLRPRPWRRGAACHAAASAPERRARAAAPAVATPGRQSGPSSSRVCAPWSNQQTARLSAALPQAVRMWPRPPRCWLRRRHAGTCAATGGAPWAAQRHPHPRCRRRRRCCSAHPATVLACRGRLQCARPTTSMRPVALIRRGTPGPKAVPTGGAADACPHPRRPCQPAHPAPPPQTRPQRPPPAMRATAPAAPAATAAHAQGGRGGSRFGTWERSFRGARGVHARRNTVWTQKLNFTAHCTSLVRWPGRAGWVVHEQETHAPLTPIFAAEP
eukprot:357243-Chlamydomonas_euryale.AAC.1